MKYEFTTKEVVRIVVENNRLQRICIKLVALIESERDRADKAEKELEAALHGNPEVTT